MSLFEEPELQDLALGLVVANTPGAFASWLLRHPAVARLAETTPVSTILDELAPILRVSDRSERALGAAYGYVAALAKIASRTESPNDVPLDLSSLRWGREIWRRQNSRPPSTSYSFQLQQSAPSAAIASEPSPPASLGLLVNQFGDAITQFKP